MSDGMTPERLYKPGGGVLEYFLGGYVPPGTPPPSLSFEPVSISPRYIMHSFQTSARLFIQDGGVSARGLRQNTPALHAHAKTQGATRVRQFAC